MMTRDYQRGFFDEEGTKGAISALASATSPITLFVGAGSSADLGIPTWAALVRKMLEARLPTRHGETAQQRTDIADYLVRAHFQLPSASIVDQLVLEAGGWADLDGARATRNEEIRQLLYGQAGAKPRAGSLGYYLLLLAIWLRQAGRDVHIVTTNYDDSLMRTSALPELLEAAGDIKFVRFWQSVPAAHDKNVIPIVHVHGFLEEGTGEGGNVVFSERDYIDWTDPTEPERQAQGPAWSSYLEDRFAAGQLLCVGTTLRDYNIATLLVRTTPTNHARVALLPLQGDPLMDHLPLGSHAHEYLAQRAAQLGVTALRPDFYSQVHQFLHEVLLHLPPVSPSLQPYDARLRQWWQSWQTRLAAPAESDIAISRSLAATCSQLRTRINGAERVKIEVWMRTDPDSNTRGLARWASSQMVRMEGAYPHTAPLRALGKYSAVDAFAERTLRSGKFLEAAPTRWTDYLAMPLLWRAEDTGAELPVGAIVAVFYAPPHARPLLALERHQNWVGTLLTNKATELLLLGGG